MPGQARRPRTKSCRAKRTSPARAYRVRVRVRVGVRVRVRVRD